jgi:hypothetical protein
MAYEPLAPLLPLRSLLTPDHIAHLDRGILDAHQYTDEAVAGVQAGAVSDLALDTAITRAVDDGRIPIHEVPDLTISETQEGVYNVGDAGQILGLTAGKKLPAAAKNDLATDLADAATGIGKAVADKFALKGEAASSSAEFVASNAVGEYAWNYPMAMYRTTPGPRTYFGATDSAGNLLACYFDHGTGKARRQIIGTSTVVDDHHIPTASVPEGAPQLWMWNNHNRDSIISYRVGDRTGDLETLGPIRTVNAGGSVSYAAVIRNPTNPLEVWMLNRRWPASSPYDWAIRRGVINEFAKDVVWDNARTFIQFPTNPTVQGYVTVAPVTLANGDYGFRFAATGNPTNGDFHDVLYGMVNLVTGAVESPGKTLTANVRTGAGLPLQVTDLATIYAPPAGNTARLFAVRDAGAPAVAVATWNPAVAGSPVEYYHVTYLDGGGAEGQGLVLPASGAYASSPAPVSLRTAQDISLRLFVRATTSAIGAKGLVRRYGAVDGERVFQFRSLGSGSLRLVAHTTGAASPNITIDSSVAPTVVANQVIGLRVDIDSANDVVRFYTSTDDGVTWVQLGTDRTAAGLALFNTAAPLEVGSSATDGFTGAVPRVEVLSLDGATTHVAQDFRTGAGSWTLAGGASIHQTVTTSWATDSLGVAGAPFGMATSSRYVGGLAYPTPSKGTVLYRARESGGMHYLEKLSKESGTWVPRELDQSSTHALARPMPIEGQGPLEAIYSAFSSYAGFTNFKGDYRGV